MQILSKERFFPADHCSGLSVQILESARALACRSRRPRELSQRKAAVSGMELSRRSAGR